MSWLYLLAVKGLFKYCYVSEIDVNESIQEVWSVLTDCPSYPDWSKVTVMIDTDWTVGNEVFLTVKLRPKQKTMLITYYMTEFQPYEKITWKRNAVHVKSKREQTLHSKSPTITTYTSILTVSGIISPLLHLITGKSIRKRFEQMANSLKDYVEQKPVN